MSGEAPQRSRADLIPLGAWALGFVALAAIKAHWLAVPQDTSAYLAAADVISQGMNPYTQIAQSPLYQGFPFIYYPGLAPLSRVIAAIPLWLVLFVDTLCRGVAGAWITREVVRRTGVALPWQGLMLGWLCLDPFVTDLYVGNLELFMCAMWVGVMYLAENERLTGWRASLVAVALGALMIAKPMWGIPTVYVAALRRRWDIVVGLAAGAGCVLAVGGLFYGAQIADWLEVVAATRAHWPTFDLGRAHPVVVAVGGLAWGVMGFKLWWTRREGAWLWAASSLLVWPRLGTYCFVLALPLLLWVVKRHGRIAGLVCALPVSLVVSFAWPDEAAWRMCLMYLAMFGMSAAWLLDEPSHEDA